MQVIAPSSRLGIYCPTTGLEESAQRVQRLCTERNLIALSLRKPEVQGKMDWVLVSQSLSWAFVFQYLSE